MKVRSSRMILVWLAVVFLGGMILLALTGDQEARRELPAQIAAWGTIGLLVWAGWCFKVKPRRELHQGQARSLRLTSTAGDPLGFLEKHFVLLGQVATAKDIENTSWGSWRGLDVAVFDYWFARSSDPQVNDYHYYTCATTPVPSGWANISIAPERLWSRLADPVGARDIEFELESFNRAFEVRSEDRRFASALVDARMMEWLLGLPIGTGFEIQGGTLLCLTPRRADADVTWALETMVTFKSRIPPVVESLFGELPLPPSS
jgi:hypothetical protein